MRISRLAFLWSLAVIGTAGADPTYKPAKKYRSSSGSGKILETPEAACQDSIDGLKKNGNKQTFVKVIPGSDDKALTCELKGTDGKPWDQTNSITILSKCQDGTDSISGDSSGTLASQVCPCDPAKGCPVETKDECAAADLEDRCRPAKRVTKRTDEQAERLSKRNEADAKKDHGIIIDKYNKAKDEIRTAQERENRIKFKNPTARGFPEFDKKDLCTGGPNDINIGVLCGFDDGDFAAANNLAGYKETPAGCTWHHHEDLGRFLLLKSSHHAPVLHWGGRSIWKKAFNVPYPSHCAKKQP